MAAEMKLERATPATVGNTPYTPPKISYHTLSNLRPEPPGLSTPPINIPGSIPFRWEEAPGKPKRDHLGHLLPPRHLTKPSASKALHLPPRLSPTTVLRGSHPDGRMRHSMSFGEERRGGSRRERVGFLWRKLGKGRRSCDMSVSPSVPPPSLALSPSSSSSSFGSGGSDQYIDVYDHCGFGCGGGGGGGGGGGEEEEHGITSVTISRIHRSRSMSDIPSPSIPHWLATVYDKFRKVIPGRWNSVK